MHFEHKNKLLTFKSQMYKNFEFLACTSVYQPEKKKEVTSDTSPSICWMRDEGYHFSTLLLKAVSYTDSIQMRGDMAIFGVTFHIFLHPLYFYCKKRGRCYIYFLAPLFLCITLWFLFYIPAKNSIF